MINNTSIIILLLGKIYLCAYTLPEIFTKSDAYLPFYIVTLLLPLNTKDQPKYSSLSKKHDKMFALSILLFLQAF